MAICVRFQIAGRYNFLQAVFDLSSATGRRDKHDEFLKGQAAGGDRDCRPCLLRRFS
jgi:hypothetical protein